MIYATEHYNAVFIRKRKNPPSIYIHVINKTRTTTERNFKKTIETRDLAEMGGHFWQILKRYTKQMRQNRKLD